MIRWWTVFGLVCGCAKSAPPMRMYATEAPPPPESAPAEAPRPSEPPGAAGAVEPVRGERRMVHYDGWVRSRVADPRIAVEDVAAVAAEVGGRTERLHGHTVTVRVPVARFEEAWARVLAVGDVVDHSVRAADVTEAFVSTDLRVRTLRETQKRLIELLGRAKDEEEKLRLLQSITEVTEELDRLESQLRVLDDLAAMSRISAEFEPRRAFTATGGRPAVDGFGWIAELSPFHRAVGEDDKRIELPVPEGLVVLSPRGPFVAESADGTVLWTGRVQNDPVGDADFWRAAIEERLGDEFADPESVDLGAWRCLAVSEPGADEPYRWEVCVRTVGNKVHLAQVFAPGPAEVARYVEAIRAALAGGAA